MKIVGHCRFSYLGASDTGREVRDLDAAQRLLWNPERMAVRFHLFETITLPSIRHQTDPDFLFAVITSARMPGPYRDRLAALLEGLPNARLILSDKPNITAASREIMAEASNDHRDPSIHFRLDDDDAVAADYVRTLRAAAAGLEPTTVLTFVRGVMGFLDGTVARHRPFQKFAIAIGYAILKEARDDRSPFHIQHHRFAKQNRVHYDNSFPAFHYTRHSTNNTAGYAHTIHHGGDVAAQVVAQSHAAAPELAQGAVTTPEAEAILHAAFPWTTPARLRAAIEATLTPALLPDPSRLPDPAPATQATAAPATP